MSNHSSLTDLSIRANKIFRIWSIYFCVVLVGSVLECCVGWTSWHGMYGMLGVSVAWLVVLAFDASLRRKLMADFSKMLSYPKSEQHKNIEFLKNHLINMSWLAVAFVVMSSIISSFLNLYLFVFLLLDLPWKIVFFIKFKKLKEC